MRMKPKTTTGAKATGSVPDKHFCHHAAAFAWEAESASYASACCQDATYERAPVRFGMQDKFGGLKLLDGDRLGEIGGGGQGADLPGAGFELPEGAAVGLRSDGMAVDVPLDVAGER